MELRINDYVRTRNLGGSIEKIIEILPKEKTEDLITRYTTDVSVKYNLRITENEIIKSSPNIIDLIFKDDFVNGFRVCDSTCGLVIIAPTEDIREMNSIKDEFRNNGLFVSKVYKLEDIEIKSIVTKEQFKEMEYKIGD